MTKDEFEARVIFMGFKRHDTYGDNYNTKYKDLWKIPTTTIYFQYLYDHKDLLTVSLKLNEFDTFSNWDEALNFLSEL